MEGNIGDNEIEQEILKLGKNINNIDRWSFINEFNKEVIIDIKLCIKLNKLNIGEKLMHYKFNYFMYNMHRYSQDECIQVNVQTGSKRILKRKKMNQIDVCFEIC